MALFRPAFAILLLHDRMPVILERSVLAAHSLGAGGSSSAIAPARPNAEVLHVHLKRHSRPLKGSKGILPTSVATGC